MGRRSFLLRAALSFLGAGTALYLLGTVMFRFAFGIQPLAARLVAVVVAAATPFVGGAVSALAQVGLLITTVAGLLAVESRARASGGGRLGSSEGARGGSDSRSVRVNTLSTQ